MGETRQITGLVVYNFSRWLKKVLPPEADPKLLGIDPDDPETIKKFLKEYCEDITYSECKDLVMKRFAGLLRERKAEYDEQYIKWAEQKQLEELKQIITDKFGKPYISDIMKDLFSRGVISVEVIEDVSQLPEDVRLIFDYITARFGCAVYDIRELGELVWLGAKGQPIKYGTGTIDEFARQLEYFLGLKPAESIEELIDYPINILVAGFIPTNVLVCFLEKHEEGKLIPLLSVTPDKEFIVGNLRVKKYLILS